MQHSGIALSPRIKHPELPLALAGARAWSLSGHRAVLLRRSRPGRRARAPLVAAQNSRTIGEVISIESTNQDPKLRVDKYFEAEMTVHDCELDRYGVVNNSIYATYIEKAREELLESLDISTGSIACAGNAMALSELNLKYFTPLRRGEKFVVKVRLVRIKGVRIYAEHFIETLPDRKLVLEATATIVCLNKDYRPARVFPEMSSKLHHVFSS